MWSMWSMRHVCCARKQRSMWSMRRIHCATQMWSMWNMRRGNVIPPPPASGPAVNNCAEREPRDLSGTSSWDVSGATQ
eukprot:2668595-Alexandrium_andersonii.AAC.1